MSELSPTDVAPRWIWLATAACLVLAPTVYAVAGGAYATLVQVLAGAAAVGVLYLLYRWGQVREKPSSEKSDREREQEAEAGGYGGSGGGA
jgi:membrane protein implicated in regulation of membrane protease activity